MPRPLQPSAKGLNHLHPNKLIQRILLSAHGTIESSKPPYRNGRFPNTKKSTRPSELSKLISGEWMEHMPAIREET